MPMAAFPARHWRERVPCTGCGKAIKTGIVAANAPTPPLYALCPACYEALMEAPATFEQMHPLYGGLTN